MLLLSILADIACVHLFYINLYGVDIYNIPINVCTYIEAQWHCSFLLVLLSNGDKVNTNKNVLFKFAQNSDFEIKSVASKTSLRVV